jgi:uncharacterized protein YcaQ
MPRHIAAATLLSPFDPVAWYRPRTARLFLLGDRPVGRVDLKADRPGRRLLVRAAYVELHDDPRAVAKALARELQTMARWLGLDSVAVERRGNLARELKAAL